MQFRDRTDAGQQLAEQLTEYAGQAPLVLALPRGGVPVAYPIARALGAPLDVLVVRKLGAPGQPELAIGAVADGGGRYLNEELIAQRGVGETYVEEITRRELLELERRVEAYRGERPPLDVRERAVILVDDGLATGATMRAAVRSLRRQAPRTLVLAIPVCAPDTADELRREVDRVVCTLAPRDFGAVGHWYEDFGQTSDAVVIELLGRADAARGGAPQPERPDARGETRRQAPS